MPRVRSNEKSFEYLEHMADIQIHAWGDILSDAFENTALGMWGYMTDATKVAKSSELKLEVSGHDMNSLLYAFLHEILYVFATQKFIGADIHVAVLDTTDRYFAKFSVVGEEWREGHHTQGTEIKAITMNHMNVELVDEDGLYHIHVVVDI
jgi:SHS2 domain-containing protein